MGPWQPLGQEEGASSRSMMASRGFRCTGHAALEGAICIAKAHHHHGYQNGQRKRCFVTHHQIFVLTA